METSYLVNNINDYISIDTKTQLVINRLTRSAYNLLSAENQIQQDELYLVDDEVFDVDGKRVVNVQTPINDHDSVNLQYLNNNYIKNDKLLDYTDISRIYNVNIPNSFPRDSVYIQGNGDVYKKDNGYRAGGNNSNLNKYWTIDVLKPDGFTAQGKVIVKYDESSSTHYGWQIGVKTDNGSWVYHGNNQDVDVDTIYMNYDISGTIYEISATSWKKIDKLVTRAELSIALSGLNEQSTFDDFKKAFLNLKNALSSI